MRITFKRKGRLPPTKKIGDTVVMVCAIPAKGPNNSSVHSQFGKVKCSKPELKNAARTLNITSH
jgi:hypothetical protein